MFGKLDIFIKVMRCSCLWEANSLLFNSTSYPHRSLSNSTDLKTVSWFLSPVSYAGWLLKQRNAASMERLSHVYRRVSWPSS